MMSSKHAIAAALVLPIVALGILTSYRQYIYATGQDVILPISGYDPRNLISGHYLSYSIDYGTKDICPLSKIPDAPAIVCLNPKSFIYGDTPPKGCTLFIRGACESPHRFTAGVERYYIPEHQGSPLEEKVQSQKAAILLSVTKNGRAMVKDLLINGKSWKTPEAQ